MNKLSYGLLSFLSTEPQTGYDLMLRLNQIWNTTHSAIYPLLSELEEKNYVGYTLIEQTGKPDKKIYSITGQGVEALKKWIASATDAPVVKDEMMLKLYCIQVLDEDTIEALLTELEDRCKKDLERYAKALDRLKNAVDGNMSTFKSPRMGTYILLQKRMAEVKVVLEWCSWVRGLCSQNEKINFLDNRFTPASDA